MDIRFHEKLYRNDFSDRKLAAIKKKIQKKSPKLKLFLITLPIGNQGILEVYWYPELLQPFYRNMKKEAVVVGIAEDREEAFALIETIIKDIGLHDGKIPINEFFGGTE